MCANFVSIHFAEIVSTDITLVDSIGSLSTEPYANWEILPGTFPADTSFFVVSFFFFLFTYLFFYY